MRKILLDANLSPQTSTYLSDTFHFDVVDLQTRQLGQIQDEDVVQLAIKEKRIIITLDKDFGEIYYLRERGKLGVLVLRIKDQTVESVNKILYDFFNNPQAAVNHGCQVGRATA